MDMDYEQFYNAYYMKVYSFVMTLAKNQDISEEITQKTFLVIYQKNHKPEKPENIRLVRVMVF